MLIKQQLFCLLLIILCNCFLINILFLYTIFLKVLYLVTYFVYIGATAFNEVIIERDWSIAIKDLNCTGNESSIWDCPMNGLQNYSCNHDDDAAVVCQCKI